MLSAICISSLEKCLFKLFAHFLIKLFGFYCCVVRVLHIFWILNPYDLQIFSPNMLVFFSLLIILFAHKLLILIFSNLPIFPFVACGFGVTSEKSLPNPTS